MPLDLPLLVLYELLLLLDLLLLLFDRIDEGGRDLSVFHAFDFASVVARRQQRLDFLDFFRRETEVAQSVGFPVETDRPQAADEV